MDRGGGHGDGVPIERPWSRGTRTPKKRRGKRWRKGQRFPRFFFGRGALLGVGKGEGLLQPGQQFGVELGLFGEFTIRVDESVKAVERMYTILGDAMVGGNLVVDKGFVVATTPAGG